MKCLRSHRGLDRHCIDTIGSQAGLMCALKPGRTFGGACKMRDPEEPCGGPTGRTCKYRLLCTSWSPFETGVCRHCLRRDGVYSTGTGRKCKPTTRCVAAAAEENGRDAISETWDLGEDASHRSSFEMDYSASWATKANDAKFRRPCHLHCRTNYLQ